VIELHEHAELIGRARDISSQAGFRSDALQTGFQVFILQELQRLNRNIEKMLTTGVQLSMDTPDKTLAMREIEAKYGKPIAELLREQQDKSIRDIAEEWGVSKSSISAWRKIFG